MPVEIMKGELTMNILNC